MDYYIAVLNDIRNAKEDDKSRLALEFIEEIIEEAEDPAVKTAFIKGVLRAVKEIECDRDT